MSDVLVVDSNGACQVSGELGIFDVKEDDRDVGFGQPPYAFVRARKGCDDSVIPFVLASFDVILRQFRWRLDDPDVPTHGRAEESEDADELLPSGGVCHFKGEKDFRRVVF